MWSTFISTIKENKDSAFELHAIVTLESNETAPKAPPENSAHGLAKNITKEAWDATGFRFNFKKKQKSHGNESVTVYTFYCAQLSGEQTKHKLNEDTRK
ncbi:hypothetical protein L208DRAFT_1525171 [Tricholoma matsutake]|nr:hypothetical protein L208DRAFT_1525171 [Tricholoma matsutake 945]